MPAWRSDAVTDSTCLHSHVKVVFDLRRVGLLLCGVSMGSLYTSSKLRLRFVCETVVVPIHVFNAPNGATDSVSFAVFKFVALFKVVAF